MAERLKTVERRLDLVTKKALDLMCILAAMNIRAETPKLLPMLRVSVSVEFN